jgi:serine/threonine protein phosphatase 1
VGDLVDRGEESPAVLDAVHRHQIKAVRGNHEQMILDWTLNGGLEHIRAYKASLADPHTDADSVLANVAYRHDLTSSLLHNGGEWFVELYSSDVDATSQLGRWIVEYFSALPWAIEIETVHGVIGVVHADVPCLRWSELIRLLEKGRFDHPVREQVLWDRRRWAGHEASTLIEGVTAVIVGHTPTQEAAQRGNVINIDTGAVYGGKLTVFDLADVQEWVVHGDRPFTRKLV